MIRRLLRSLAAAPPPLPADVDFCGVCAGGLFFALATAETSAGVRWGVGYAADRENAIAQAREARDRDYA